MSENVQGELGSEMSDPKYKTICLKKEAKLGTDVRASFCWSCCFFEETFIFSGKKEFCFL